MPAIGVHHTATVDEPWDGPAAVAAMPNNEATLRYCHAWADSGAGDVKSGYRFPHHRTNGGPANLPACRNGLARVSQSSIPAGDKDGVRRHLQAHLDDAARDADPEALPSRTVARDDLTRTAPFAVRSDSGDARSDGLTLDGYGAVFGAETIIDSWEGQFREVIAPGAFRKSLQERTPRMQFDHGRHPLIGSIPIGTFDEGYPREDRQGLHVVARLADNWLVQPVREAIASGAIDGMSFRFSIVREQWTDPAGRKLTDPRTIAEFLWRPPEDGLLLRTVQEVKLSEVGPVVWPAYEQTDVTVRSGIIDLARLNEPAQRTLLARAVLLADALDGEYSTTARPRPSAPAPAHHTPPGVPEGSDGAPGEHQVPTRQDEPAHLRTDLGRWLSTRRLVVENALKGAPQ